MSPTIWRKTPSGGAPLVRSVVATGSEKVGEKPREMMPWIKKGALVDKAKN